MEEPITRKELLEKIKSLKKELQELEGKKTPISSMSISEVKGWEYLKATAELKERIRIKGLLRKYEYMLTKCSYEEGTSRWVGDLQDSTNLPAFSWGIREKEEEGREIILKQSEGDEYIEVVNCGKFEYLTGKSGVHIQDMPNSDYVTIGERLNLVRITKGIEPNQRSYFILSPIQKEQLEDKKVREFFIKEYCSDLYLESVTKGNNGIYAGNISKSEEGVCSIQYSKASTRAAKLAEMVPGSTILYLELLDGETRELPGTSETFDGIIKRLSTVKDKEESKRWDIDIHRIW